jgi:hypothetical protein
MPEGACSPPARCIVGHNSGASEFLWLLMTMKFYPMTGKKRVDDKDELKHSIRIRVNDEKYRELCKLLEGNPRQDMSGLVRNILYNRPVKILTRDTTFDSVMEELAKLRTELKAIGVNINQITRWFNSFPETERKLIQAKAAFNNYLLVKPRLDRLLEIVSMLAEKWLQG